MLDERTQHLINADIDGVLEASERAELESLLETSAEARALRAELNNLDALLDTLPDQEPPAELAERIMEQVRVPRRPSFSLTTLFASFQPAPAAAAFAAGLLVAIAFYEVGWRGQPTTDVAHMVGTIMAKRESATPVSKDRVELSAPGIEGTISLSVDGEIFVLDVDFETDQPTEMLIGMADAGLQFGGIAQAAADAAIEDSYEVSGGALRVESQGRKAFSVFLRQAANRKGQDREIPVTVSSAGVPVFSGVLRS